MSAETLRRAAALMRERAEAATPGPWHQEFYRDGELLPDGTGGMDNYETPGSMVYAIDSGGNCSTEFDAGFAKDATHIASWHPAVALAVADLINNIIGAQEQDVAAIEQDALAVARAFLEEQA